jgi:hypothetical protein
MITTNDKEFTSVVKDKNFMTPDINGYWISGNYICEVSHGRDFSNNLIYGVTVVNGETMQHEHDLSKMFTKRKDAFSYVKVLGA